MKKRIVEYVAVRKLAGDKKAPILCFIGPPGVGKTSLGRSIARSMGRRYHRIALGGVRDEAEIRGHRRTYVGALPGRIVQGLKKVGVKNPVLVLDEVDKMGVDMLGDPAAALLEVLDPEQNSTFQDHYLDVPFDLSQVTFLCTANNPDTIPEPLLDRMEVIEVPRLHARREAEHREGVPVPQAALRARADRRAPRVRARRPRAAHRGLHARGRRARARARDRRGVPPRRDAHRRGRSRPSARRGRRRRSRKSSEPPRHLPDLAERTSSPGVATGLAWTPSGGDILFIEATQMPGKGEVLVTGNLKSVMSESAATAVSFVRSQAKELGLDPEFLKEIDLHLHVPKGGTPKDGPSAGVTMFTAVASLLLGCAVKKDVAMTGEITLRGSVLPVGGIKEKLLAAHRAGIKEVLVPARNEPDLEELPSDVRGRAEGASRQAGRQVLALVLEPPAVAPPAIPAPPHFQADGEQESQL